MTICDLPFWLRVLLVLWPIRLLADDPADPREAARAVSDLVRQQTGSANTLRQNSLNPLMGSGDLSSYDGQKTVAVRQTCPASNVFLRITVQRLSTDDLQITTLEQDVAMQGKVDRTLTPNWQVSGICANGFIQCTPGSWQDCHSYRWTVKPDRTLGIERTVLSDLGGCYCINRSCQGPSRSNLKAVLEHLGAGLAATLSRADPFYTISQIQWQADQPHRIAYVGQHGGQCQSVALDQGTSLPVRPLDQATEHQTLGKPLDLDTLKSYRHEKLGSGRLRQQGATVATQHPLAQALVELKPPDPVTHHDCWIRRHLDMDETTLDQIIRYDSGSPSSGGEAGVRYLPGEGSVQPCGDDCLELVLGNATNNQFGDGLYQRDVRFQVQAPERIVSAVLHKVDYDDWLQVAVNGQYVWSGPRPDQHKKVRALWTDLVQWQPGKRELKQSWHDTPNVDFTAAMKQSGTVVFRVRLAVGGAGEGYAFVRIKADTRCRLKPDVIDNGCLSLAHNPRCTLHAAWTEGAPVFQRHGGLDPYGRTPQVAPSARTEHGERCTFTETRDWWEKRQRYECHHDALDVNLDRALARRHYVGQHSTDTQYQDQAWDESSGQHRYRQGPITVPEDKGGPCLPYCKTTRPRPQSDVSQYGVTGAKQRQPLTVDTVYRECDPDTLECPAEAGDTVQQPCQCLDDFGYAATMMDIVNEAAKDTHCLE